MPSVVRRSSPPLQQLRRHGPARLRAAALEVLVMIVGEGGLHPADVAAAERLVRIKLQWSLS